MKCIVDHCPNSNGPNALEIHHQGKVVAYVCDVCLTSITDIRLCLSRDDLKESFQVHQVEYPPRIQSPFKSKEG